MEAKYLYHYSTKKLTKLLTLELQNEVGIRTFTKEFINKEEKRRKFRGDQFSRLKQISFMIDKLPYEVIKKASFPDNHPYKAKSLYCHTIEIAKLKDILFWELVESPFDMFIRNIFWKDRNKYKYYYFRINKVLKRLIGERGNSIDKISKISGRYKITYDKYFDRWINSKKFETTKHMYAYSVPHILVYTKKEVPVLKVEKVINKSSQYNLQGHHHHK
jgi:hypothetical protein